MQNPTPFVEQPTEGDVYNPFLASSPSKRMLSFSTRSAPDLHHFASKQSVSGLDSVLGGYYTKRVPGVPMEKRLLSFSTRAISGQQLLKIIQEDSAIRQKIAANKRMLNFST